MIGLDIGKERIEIIVGRREEPSVHIISTIDELNATLEKLLSPRPLPPPTHLYVTGGRPVEEPFEIQKVRLEFAVQERRLRGELEDTLMALRLDEKIAVVAARSKLMTPPDTSAVTEKPSDER